MTTIRDSNDEASAATRYTHHTRDADWRFDPTRQYDNDVPSMKPTGLWLSVDGDWERWCRGDGMDHWLEGPVFEFEIIEPDHILTLTTEDEVRRFSDWFTKGHDTYRLPWAQLTEGHAGIMIAPYQWTLRLDWDVHWYYTWDCASACIWDLSVVRLVDNGMITTATTNQGESTS